MLVPKRVLGQWAWYEPINADLPPLASPWTIRLLDATESPLDIGEDDAVCEDQQNLGLVTLTTIKTNCPNQFEPGQLLRVLNGEGQIKNTKITGVTRSAQPNTQLIDMDPVVVRPQRILNMHRQISVIIKSIR